MRTVVGTDIQSVHEVAASIEGYGTRYTSRVFTDNEIASSSSCSSSAARNFAAQFAAKEAVLKIFDLRAAVPSWKSIEVQWASGWPEIVLHAEAAEMALQQGMSEIVLSVSHTRDEAMATVVAQIDKQLSETHS